MIEIINEEFLGRLADNIKDNLVYGFCTKRDYDIPGLDSKIEQMTYIKGYNRNFDVHRTQNVAIRMGIANTTVFLFIDVPQYSIISVDIQSTAISSLMYLELVKYYNRSDGEVHFLRNFIDNNIEVVMEYKEYAFLYLNKCVGVKLHNIDIDLLRYW